mmetsp:Transcript_45094/g.110690  ORF Transcript_45094/g.110690 Transcript_45094/m.110690 type:complete len:109 (+) Transcript_45094:176-502(+)
MVRVYRNGGNQTGGEAWRTYDAAQSDVATVVREAADFFGVVPPGCVGEHCTKHMRLMDASGMQVLTWRDVFRPPRGGGGGRRRLRSGVGERVGAHGARIPQRRQPDGR